LRDENWRKKCPLHKNDAIPARTRLMSAAVICSCLRDCCQAIEQLLARIASFHRA
jgi:hypothetical protein